MSMSKLERLITLMYLLSPIRTMIFKVKDVLIESRSRLQLLTRCVGSVVISLNSICDPTNHLLFDRLRIIFHLHCPSARIV